MELIERYVHAVGARIHKKTRADIEKELTSLILDQLDAKTKGRAYSEEDVIAILKEMGSPWIVAAKYNAQDKGLIGPRLIDPYWKVIKVVLGALLLGLVIATAVQIIEKPAQAGFLIFKLVGEFIPGALGCIGEVTLLFIIIERTVPKFRDFKEREVKWNPKDLPPVTKPVDRVKISESIVALAFIVIAVVLFNFFYDKIGIYHAPKTGEPVQFIPIFEKSALLSYLPFWNVLWALEFIRHIILIALGKEILATRIYSLVLPVLSIFVIAMMLGGPSILVSNAAMPDFTQVMVVLSTIYRIALIVGLVGTVIEIIKNIVMLTKSIR